MYQAVDAVRRLDRPAQRITIVRFMHAAKPLILQRGDALPLIAKRTMNAALDRLVVTGVRAVVFHKAGKDAKWTQTVPCMMAK